jgi:hypothetical protein
VTCGYVLKNQKILDPSNSRFNSTKTNKDQSILKINRMATKITKCSWADMEDENFEVPIVKKLSYASIASKGVVIANDTKIVCEKTIDDDNDFIVVSRKQAMKKCENAVLQWAKTKGQGQGSRDSKCVTKCVTDEEIICNRCGLPFVFNLNMKQKYAEKNWKTPKICKVCSQMRFEDRKSECM